MAVLPGLSPRGVTSKATGIGPSTSASSVDEEAMEWLEDEDEDGTDRGDANGTKWSRSSTATQRDDASDDFDGNKDGNSMLSELPRAPDDYFPTDEALRTLDARRRDRMEVPHDGTFPAAGSTHDSESELDPTCAPDVSTESDSVGMGLGMDMPRIAVRSPARLPRQLGSNFGSGPELAAGSDPGVSDRSSLHASRPADLDRTRSWASNRIASAASQR